MVQDYTTNPEIKKPLTERSDRGLSVSLNTDLSNNQAIVSRRSQLCDVPCPPVHHHQGLAASGQRQTDGTALLEARNPHDVAAMS